MNAIENFRAELRAHGLDYDGPIKANGKRQRFKAAGDREKNSWFVLYPARGSTAAAGAFGCWKRGINETWCEKRREKLTDAQWRVIREARKLADNERKQSEAERHSAARETAERILNASKPATAHIYLENKGVKIFGDVRENRDELVLPLRDVEGVLCSLQFIRADGTKRFLPDGQVAGCFYILADKPDGALVICEGYATGASIHEATGYAVVCAMHCGNLIAVAEVVREKYQAREIFLTADNDAWTDGNPGLTKATAAAKTIHAKLAVPHFANTDTKPTDFNDLHQREGIHNVKTQIENATTPEETDDELLQRLAALPPLEYERCRDAEADQLGVRVSILDKMVDTRRPESEAPADDLQGGALQLTDVELWPEAVSGAEVLGEISEAVSRYVALPSGGADASALWAAHTHCFELFQCSPRLNISSPEKGCGKSTLRDVISVLVPRPLPTENVSVAVLFRVIESKKPTILADEYDAWLRDNEELRGIFNAGHRRGGQVLRCVGEGYEVRGFGVFAPAVLCGIGALPVTLHDRSIVIRLERAKPDELSKRFDSRHTEHETTLRRKLARWCADNAPRLESCDPVLPSGTFNRLADNWRPLFAIAEIAGGDWPQRAADSFAKLTAKTDVDAQGIGTMLLADIQQVFTETGGSRIFSITLVENLCAKSDRPWPEANRGKQISDTWLARRLRDFGIYSRTLRIGNKRFKGYEISDFADAFERYLPAPGLSSRDSVTNRMDIDDSQFSRRDTENLVTVSNPLEAIENIVLSRRHASIPPTTEDQPEDVVLI